MLPRLKLHWIRKSLAGSGIIDKNFASGGKREEYNVKDAEAALGFTRNILSHRTEKNEHIKKELKKSQNCHHLLNQMAVILLYYFQELELLISLI